MLTQAYLKENLHYDPNTGKFIWLKNRRGGARAGDVAGTTNFRGYRVININGHLYRAHRLAWFYVYGKWPEDQLDHIDGNKVNNCLINLRECTNAENHQNMPSIKGGTSKYTGVSWYKKGKKWRANICLNNKQKNLGFFDNEEDAYAAYCKAKAEIHTFNPTPRILP